MASIALLKLSEGAMSNSYEMIMYRESAPIAVGSTTEEPTVKALLSV